MNLFGETKHATKIEHATQCLKWIICDNSSKALQQGLCLNAQLPYKSDLFTFSLEGTCLLRVTGSVSCPFMAEEISNRYHKGRNAILFMKAIP